MIFIQRNLGSFGRERWNKMLSMVLRKKGKHVFLADAFLKAIRESESPQILLPSTWQKLRAYVGSGTVSLKKTIELHKFIRLRQRYLVTKDNKLRLRYVVSSTAFILAACVTAFGQPAASLVGRAFNNSSSYYASVTSADGETQVAAYDLGGEVDDSNINGFLQERVSDGMRRAANAIQKAPKREFEEIEIGRGDTLAGVLQAAGVSGDDSYQVVKALSEHYDPRNVKPGQKISVHFKPGSEPQDGQFTKMVMMVDPVKEITVQKNSDEFVTDMKEKELVKHTYGGRATIETSLYGSAARAGIPSQITAEMIRIYSWNIDFQRDIQPGDKIEVLYEAEETEDGEYARYGNVIYANLTVGGKDVPIYRFESKDGRADYFQPDGFSIRNTLMKTPIDGARISSGFGMRRHPVLGYTKMHKGMDFAAPTGTPIYAAGDGSLEYAGRFSSYGNYIRIRHNSQLKTAYAHMNRLAKGMAVGKRVSQGDIIGYVGTTGRSTGPHLHYEVLVNNKPTNPKSVDLPTGEQLTGKELKRFKEMMKNVHQQYVSLTEGMKFAQHGLFSSSKNLN